MSSSILLVEDNRLIAFSLKRSLESEGYNVHTAHSPDETLATIADCKPDIIIMDVNLGGATDGIDLMEQILAKNEHVPHIYLSGYAQEEMLLRAEVTSPVAVYEKPIEYPVLIQALQKIVSN